MTVETVTPTIIDHNNAEPTVQSFEKKSKKPIRQVRKKKEKEFDDSFTQICKNNFRQ